MKHLFIPYELAIIAKEKGFDKQCLAFYNGKGDEMLQSIDTDFINFRSTGYCTTAPLYQQIIDWFREKYNISILEALIPEGARKAKPELFPGKHNFYLYFPDWNPTIPSNGTWGEYYEALDKVIKETFKLI